MVRYERLRGDGFTALGMTESQDFQLSDSVETARLKSVDYLHPFSSRKVSKMNVIDDVFSPEFGGLDPDKLDWSFSFNPLWKLDSQSDAEIRKKVAETDAIYLTNQVITSDEVREKRFKGSSLSAELDFSEDELTELDKSIQDARDSHGQST